jgi:hypothetical protein
MATGRKLVSDVRSMHKLLSTDSLITDRVILSEIKNVTFSQVKRETNLRKLWATDTLFTTIPCLEMCEVSISECCSYADPCTIGRSKYKIPRIAEGNYQYVIQGVYGINAMGGSGKKLKETTVNRYINLLKLPIIKKEEYFWISNDYLYITNPLVQSTRFVAYFEEDIPKDIMFPECGCGDGNLDLEEYCKNPLDANVALPGYLLKPVLEMVTQHLLQTYFRIKTDMADDGIDGQAPNAPNLK